MGRSPVYTDLFTFLANLIQISYNDTNKRPNQISRLDTVLSYEPEKSNSLYCHYENEDFIIVAVHGTNDLRLSILAIGQFISPGLESNEVQNFCTKYDNLINEDKPVFLTGHSIGCYMIVSCARRHNKKLRSFLFAPYVPRQFGNVYNDIRQDSTFKKILYDNDWLGNNMLVGDFNIRDTLVLQPKSIRGFFNGHSMFNFQRSPEIVNKDIKKYFD